MLIKLLLSLLMTTFLLSANDLKNEYYVDSKNIQLSDIIKNVQKDSVLFKIKESRYTKRIKSKELIKHLKSLGYSNYVSKSRYIKFTKKSPIDIKNLQKKVIDFYKKKYKGITIKNVEIKPRGYITSLPQDFELIFQSKSHLSNRGSFYIKTPQNKKIFFDYTLLAKVFIYSSRVKIKKDSELSLINCVKKSILLNKFRAMPIQVLQKGVFESKHQIKRDYVLTIRDVQTLRVVKRGDILNVILDGNGIAISFSAKANQDARVNDIITAIKSNGKRVKVKVIGKHRAEMK